MNLKDLISKLTPINSEEKVDELILLMKECGIKMNTNSDNAIRMAIQKLRIQKYYVNYYSRYMTNDETEEDTSKETRKNRHNNYINNTETPQIKNKKPISFNRPITFTPLTKKEQMDIRENAKKNETDFWNSVYQHQNNNKSSFAWLNEEREKIKENKKFVRTPHFLNIPMGGMNKRY